MKKILSSLAILLVASVGFSAFAQSPAQKTQTPAKSEKKVRQGERKQARNLFEGLNLTDQQKAQLKEIKPGLSKEQREEMKAQRKARMEQQAQQRKQAPRDYLAKVKAVLTPEQYVQFLENNFVEKTAVKKAPRKAGKDFRKGGKRGIKAQGPRKGGKKVQRPGRPAVKTDKGADKK